MLWVPHTFSQLCWRVPAALQLCPAIVIFHLPSTKQPSCCFGNTCSKPCRLPSTTTSVCCLLQAVFEIFFRVLKHCSSKAVGQTQPNTGDATAAPSTSYSPAVLGTWPVSKVLHKFPLLHPVLEGLGRYSHLISVEYFNDLMGVLQQVSCVASDPAADMLCPKTWTCKRLASMASSMLNQL